MTSRSDIAVLALAIAAACSSEPSLEGVGETLDVQALTDDVTRVCERLCFREFSTVEACAFYLRYDLIEFVLLTEDPEACFEMLRGPLACLAETDTCSDDRCSLVDTGACTIAEPPSVDVPAAAQPATAVCRPRPGCSPDFSDEVELQRETAFCEAGLVTQTELWFVDRGASCAEAYIELAGCLGGSQDLPCYAGPDEVEGACPGESQAFDEECFDEEDLE